MAKLILSVDGQVLKEHTLGKERTLIGRKPHNDIQIDNLAVSGEHAAIITILNDSFVEDLGSTNGTMVNGKPIKKHFLQHNDVIEIGKHKLKYFNEQQPVAGGGAADFEKTMIIRSPSKQAPAPAPAAAPAPAPAAAAAATAMSGEKMGDTHTNLKVDLEKVTPPAPPAPAPTPAPAAAAPAPAAPKPQPAAPAPAPAPAPAAAPRPQPAAPAPAAGGSLREAAVQVLSGAAAGRTLDLTKNLTTIGKPGLQVAVITKRPNGYFITHVEGATYPTLNGSSLGAQAHALSDHDLIEIAGVKMEFFYKP